MSLDGVHLDVVEVTAALALMRPVVASVTLVVVVAAFVVFALSLGTTRVLGAWQIHKNVVGVAHLVIMLGVVVVLLVAAALAVGVTTTFLFLGLTYVGAQFIAIVLERLSAYELGLELGAIDIADDATVYVPGLNGGTSGHFVDIGAFRTTFRDVNDRVWYAPNGAFTVVAVIPASASDQ